MKIQQCIPLINQLVRSTDECPPNVLPFWLNCKYKVNKQQASIMNFINSVLSIFSSTRRPSKQEEAEIKEMVKTAIASSYSDN